MKRGTGNLPSKLHRRRTRGSIRTGRLMRSLRYESLEARSLLSAAPFGAFLDDTAEYMLGDVLVTVVLMESNTNISAVNQNTEDWTPAQIAAVKEKVQQGGQWWEQTLATQFPDSPHQLNFQFDFTYTDQPVLTSYEPISQISDAFQYWMYDFLRKVGYDQRGNFGDDIRAFNHAQRLAYGTDWAFTVFVVNDAKDFDGEFAPSGSFPRAFSYAGGQFIVSPAKRPASTFAHETGHMFWARDEYAGGGSYSDRRGYYNTQNTNAADNPTPGFTQVNSIMTTGSLLDGAYNAHTSSVSSLEMIGWRDSDNDGVFDVLDEPNTLSGTGFLDPLSGLYRFVGDSSVQALPNLNPSGLQNDITLNKIGRAEVRVDGGVWTTVATFDAPVADLDLEFVVPASGTHTVELRTVDAVSEIASPIFQGDTAAPSSVLRQGINGFVFHDGDGDGVLQNAEGRLSGWTVRLVDAAGAPLNLSQTLDPDAYAAGTVLNSVLTQARLSLQGDPTGKVVAIGDGTGKVFGNDTSYSAASPIWKPKTPETLLSFVQLRVDFPTPVSSVQLDASGTGGGDRARLDVYNASGILLGRYTTNELAAGEMDTMQVQRPTADIAYAVASAHAGTGVRLDRLRFGPETAVKTDAQGAYAVTSLPAGSYFVETVTPSGRVLAESRQQVVLAEGEALGQVNLVGHAGEISWQNPVRPTDVNGNDEVTALDALVIINYINAHPGDARLPSSDVPPPFYDVDGNGSVTAVDVLIVINELNTRSSADGASLASYGGEAASSSGAEGEAPLVSVLAAPSIPLPAPASNRAASAAVWTTSQAGSPSHHETPARRSVHLAANATTFHAAPSRPVHLATSLAQPDSAAEWTDLEDILRDLAKDVAGACGPSAFVAWP